MTMTTKRSRDVRCISVILLSLLLCSLIPSGNCQSLDELMKNYGSALANGSDPSSSEAVQSGLALLTHPGKAKCLQKLAPCKEFLRYEGKPPSTCCDPLAELVSNDTEDCLCIFNSEDLLRTVNISKGEALSLATTCGSKPDLSSCPNDTEAASAPSGSSTSTASFTLPPISIESSNSNPSDTTASRSEETTKESSGATTLGKISRLNGFVLIIATTLVGLNVMITPY